MSKRGRPQETDPRAVSRVALRLFERRGFDAVTMDEVAAAAAVSRRTLFRLFPSKSDLVWDGLKDARDALVQRAAALGGAGLSLSALVEQLFAPALRALDDPDAAALARRRLRLIVGSPALLHHETLREIEAALADAIARCAQAPGGPPALVARALVATTFASLLWWAEQDASALSPLDATLAALRSVALAARG